MTPAYVYLKSEPGLWTVGHYDPNGKWQSESDHSSTDAAAARVSYLNGGSFDSVLVAALQEVEAICTESAGDCRRRMGTRVGNALAVVRFVLSRVPR